MSQAARQRHEIEDVIRSWFTAMSPEDRQHEGAQMVGFMAARMAFFCPRRMVANLFYELGDQVVATARPDGDPT